MQSPLFAIAGRLIAATTLGCLSPLSLAQQPPSKSSGQGFPAKPVRVVSGTAPGSQPDMIARLIIPKMSEHWGKPVILDNRTGAGGALAAGVVAKATADGHTLLYVLPNFVISPAVHPHFAYPSIDEFVGIGQIGFSTNVLVASPALGAKTVKDFIALAKGQPGKLIIGSTGATSAGGLSGARFNLMAGIKAVSVQYKGGPELMIEILSGRAHYAVTTMGTGLPLIKEGKLVALGVTTPQRASVLPDVPALGEILPEFRQSETSHGLLAPVGTPRAILQQVSREVARVLDLPDIKDKLNGISFVIAPSTPEAYDKIVRQQKTVITNLVIAAGLRGK